MTILTNKKSMALVAGVAMTAGLTLSPTLVSAETSNPFLTTELSSGYLQLAEGKCGEAKCGANKKAKKEGKCGEAKCGATKVDKKFLSSNPSYSASLGK